MKKINTSSGSFIASLTKFSVRIVPVLALLLLFPTGCDWGKKETIVDKIHVIKGEDQCVLPGKTCKSRLIFELLGPQRPGLLGGKGSRNPVPEMEVRFVPEPGSDLEVIPAVDKSNNEGDGISGKQEYKFVSDAGGAIRVWIKSGKITGDQYLKIVPVGFEKAAKTIRVINGVELSGNKQEAHAGNKLTKPISMKIVDAKGNPIPDAEVYFHLSSTPEKKPKASCKPSTAKTDKDGIASTHFKVGKDTGIYKITAEVSAPKKNIHIRGIEIKEFGLNVWVMVITVLGGLAIFIFGMKQMTSGLQMVAGEKMKTVLEFFTSNRVIAVMAGALVTGVIQSSSACTVMVVGFVNAGLLNLAQSIGIVFGANIGTTVTAQLISFKLGGLAFPAIIIGLVMMFFSRRFIVRGWGQTFLGFGFLFFGLTVMSTELKLMGKFPSFMHFFQQFNCTPLDGGSMPIGAVLGAILIGTVMTVMIQSSSATIGIALSLAMGGLINFYTAVPLILGDNIGTTITAVLASLGANRTAKQTAAAHCLFNIIGTIYMVIFFYVPYPRTNIPIFLYIVNAVTPGNVFAEEPVNIARHIAMAHTMFNVFNVLLFLPFVGIIARICRWIVPAKEGETIQVKYLEPHLLDTPSVALEQSIFTIRYMVKESWDMIEESVNNGFLPAKKVNKITDDLERRETEIDQLQLDVTDYLIQITQRELSESQTEIIPHLMHCANDAERIADHAENIIALAKRLENSKNKLSDTAIEDLDTIWKVLCNQADNVIDSLESTCNGNVTTALKDEESINKLAEEFEKRHVKRTRKGKCDATTGIIFIEMLAELEKIGDHFKNIAERAPEIQHHHLKLHGGPRDKSEDSPEQNTKISD